MYKKIASLTLAVFGAAFIPTAVLADSASNINGGPISVGAKLSIVVPKLMLLRVGAVAPTAGGDLPALPFNPVLSFSPDPGWDGVAPTSTSPSQTVQAYAWTNNLTGAKLTCTQTGLNTVSGIGPYVYDVSVTNTAIGTAPILVHPGTDLSCPAGGSPIVTNTLFDANWKYTLDGAAVAGAIPAGTYPVAITYTLTNNP